MFDLELMCYKMVQNLGASSHMVMMQHTHMHTLVLRPSGPCPGLPKWAGKRTNLYFTEARDSEWQWHQLVHMQICTSLQTDNHATTHHSVFYRPDALPAAQATVSKHWRS